MHRILHKVVWEKSSFYRIRILSISAELLKSNVRCRLKVSTLSCFYQRKLDGMAVVQNTQTHCLMIELRPYRQQVTQFKLLGLIVPHTSSGSPTTTTFVQRPHANSMSCSNSNVLSYLLMI